MLKDKIKEFLSSSLVLCDASILACYVHILNAKPMAQVLFDL